MTDIKRVTIPALVITGENDEVNPVPEGKKVADALKDSRFHVIPNAGHVAFMKEEGLKEVCSLIDDFLTVELTYSDHEPLGNMRTKFLNDIFFPAFERESHGRIKITPHWNAKISTGYDALKSLRSGSADMAVVVPEYCMKDLRLHQLFKSFPAGPEGQEQVEFFNGQRWRSASFWHKDFLANAGAEPVTMPWGPGVSEALNDGRLDGLIVNIDSGYGRVARRKAHQCTQACSPHTDITKIVARP